MGLLPSGHQPICIECADDADISQMFDKKCPICREPINKVVKSVISNIHDKISSLEFIPLSRSQSLDEIVKCNCCHRKANNGIMCYGDVCGFNQCQNYIRGKRCIMPIGYNSNPRKTIYCFTCWQ